MNKQWAVIDGAFLQGYPARHVVPMDDDEEHEYDDCWCRPRATPINGPYGLIQWTVTHNAMDGRL